MKKLIEIIESQPIDGYFGTPQYENYGNTSAIVDYNYSQAEEEAMTQEQKDKTIEAIECDDFLEWDFVIKHWDRLMENEKLLERVKRILINKVINY